MVNPTGYTALDLIGFTDQGTYSSSDNYVKNDLVHYSGNIWRCLIDDTTGIAPAEGVNWTLFIGEPTNLVERIIAPVETDPATNAWAVGRQIIYNDNLYEVIAAITAGDALVTYEDDPTNANIKLADPVESQVLAQKTQIQTLTNEKLTYSCFKDKKILILGDSNSVEGESWRGRTWVTDFREILSGIAASITNNSTSGRTISKPSGSTNNLVDVVDNLPSNNDYDYVIVFCGINDWNNQIDFGSLNTYQNFNTELFDDALQYCQQRLANKCPKATFCYVTPLLCNYGNTEKPLVAYSAAIKNCFAGNRSIVVIDGFSAPGYIVNRTNETYYSIDGLHPNALYAPILARYIANSISNGGSPRSRIQRTKSLTVNSALATGNSYLTYFEDGTTEFFMDATLTSTTYAGFIDGGIPSFAYETYGAVMWYAECHWQGGGQSLEALYIANGSPYPSGNHYNVGDRYIIRIKFNPVAMNKTYYDL